MLYSMAMCRSPPFQLIAKLLGNRVRVIRSCLCQFAFAAF